MSCKLTKNKNQKITGVLDQNGNDSKLFRNIIANPHLNVEEAIDVFKNIFTPKLYFQIIGKKGAENLDSTDSTIKNRTENLYEAVRLEKEGRPEKEIKFITGWEKVNGEWKFEILDVEYQDKNIEIGKEYSLEEVLKDNEIFQAYPNSKNVKIKFNEDGITGYRRDINTIEINTRLGDSGLFGTREDLSNAEKGIRERVEGGVYSLQSLDGGNIIHELVHFVQYEEGFYTGGSPNLIKEEAFRILNFQGEDTKEVRVEKVQGFLASEESSQSDRNIVSSYLASLNIKEYLNIAYQNIAGEIEARNVEFRVGMTYEEKRNSLLKETEENGLRIREKDKIFIRDSSEPTLSYQNPQGESFPTFAEALRNTQEGEIKAFLNEEEVFSIDSDSNENTYNGMINHLIKEEILTGRQILDKDGRLIHITEGASEIKKIINAQMTEATAIKTLGRSGVSQTKSSDIVFQKSAANTRTVVNKQGEIVEADNTELQNVSFEELKQNYDNPEVLLAEQTFRNMSRTFSGKKILEEAQEFVPENELQKSLIDLLQKLGIKTTSIESYQEAYAKKNGELPSAQALADITNKIIAFQNGEITQDTLTEEVAHFIVEASDQAEIEDLLRNIHRTQEWAEYSEQYRPLYETEEQLRREILGKVLSNALQNNFSIEQRQGLEQNIIQRIQQMFNDFMDRVRAFFKPQYQADLEVYTQRIYNNLMARNLMEELNTEQLEGNKLVMYSTPNTVKEPLDIIYQNASKALDILESQSKLISKSTSKGQIQESRSLVEDRDANAKIKSLSGIVRVTKNHTKYLQNAVKKNAQKSYPFSQEEQVVYTTTIGTLLGQLQQINGVLDTKDRVQKQIKTELEQTISEINSLKGQKENLGINVWEQHVDRMVAKHNLTPEQRDTLMKYYESATKDTNWFFMNVSSMVHAQDPLLNASADIISKMVTNSNISSYRRTKKLLNILEKLGFNPQNLKKFKRGQYILNPYDYDRMTAELDAEKVRIYNEIKGTALTQEEYLEREAEENLDLTVEQQQDFYEAQQKFEADTYKVDVLTKAARDKKNELLSKFSKKTQRFDKDMSRKRGVISREAEEIGEYTQDHRFSLEEINTQRQKAKSPFDLNGSLKKGLLIQEDGTIIQDPAYTQLEGESLLALELNQLDNLRFEEFKKKMEEDGITDKAIPELFLKKLREKPANEQLEFLQLNANMSFSNDFWDTLTSRSSIVERLEGVEEQSDELTELISDIKKAQVKRSYLLKQNRVYNQPSETSKDISTPDMESIKEIEEYLQDKYNEAKKHLPKEEYVENEFAENTTNQAYRAKLIDSDITTPNSEIEFIRGHVTPTDVKRIDAARTMGEDIIKNNRSKLSPMYEAIFNVGEYSDNINIRRSQVEEDLLRYSRSKLLPYYKRLEPVGFTEILENIQNGVMSTEQFIENYENGEYPYLNITPNYIFEQEVDNENLNPEYVYNQERGLPQIKKEYRNKEYFDEFGEVEYVKNEDGTYTPQAQKNKEDFAVLQALMEYHRETLEATGMTGRHNPYLLPQRGMRGMRQWQELTNGMKASTFKEIWKDATTYRSDEKEYGEGTDGTSLGAKQREMIIPKYGFTKLENQEDVTDELLESYTWMGHEAEVYKARLEAFADMEAIKSLILEKQYGAKKGEASNVYKMFDSAYKFNIYGQNETFSYETDLFGLLSKKQNLAPLAKKFQAWIRLVNLGFSLIVPTTSLMQGSANLMIERFVGERVDKDASRLANKYMVKYLSGAIGDTLKFNSKSRLNSMAEFFGVFNAQERFNNSNYGRHTRGLLQSSFMTHSIGDAPIKAKVILTILNDFRVVDGSIQNYQQFKKAQQLMDAKLGEKEIRTKWKGTEDNVFLKYLDTIDGVTEINNAKLAQDLGMKEDSQQFKDYVELKTQSIRDAMNILTSETDTMIPMEQKSIAQRHAIFSFFFLHRGWMTVAYNRKFKNRHMNPYTGLVEEGNWMGTATFLKSMFNEAKNPENKKGFLKKMKDVWDASDETTRRSLHRTAVEIAVTNTMALAAFVLMKLADDEDDDYAMEVVAHLSNRATNETLSSTSAFGGQIFSFLNSPIVGLEKITSLSNVFDLASSETVKQGRFKGYTEREKFIYKNLPLAREYFSISEIEHTRKNYDYFNRPNLEMPYVWSTYLLSQDDEK